MIKDKNILFVGCGRMGGALSEGLLKNNFPADKMLIIEPSLHESNHYQKDYGVQVVDGPEHIPTSFKPDVILLAVKPQIIYDILPQYKPLLNSDTLVISIAAGKTLKSLTTGLGDNIRIIRSMPNLPAMINKGVTAAFPNSHCAEDDKQIAAELFSTVGKFLWAENEDDLDAITAISGSGPAYLFYFAECLIEAAQAQGLSKDIATTLAYETLSGSTELLLSSKDSATELRKKVTSPKGTTAAALNVLMQDNPLKEAIAAATKRSKELSS